MEKDKPPDTAVTSVEENSATTESKTTHGDVTTTPTRDDHADGDTNNTTSDNKLVDTPFVHRMMKDTGSPSQNVQFDNKSFPATLGTSPSTPTTGKSADTRDYRKLYYEMKKRVLRLTESNANNLINTTTELEKTKKSYVLISLENENLNERIVEYEKKLNDYEMIKEKHQDLEAASVIDFQSLKSNYETAINDKDETITSLTKEKEGLNDLVKTLKVQNAQLSTEHEKLKATKQTEIILTRKKSEEVIRTKSKAKKGKSIAEALKCEYVDCENKDEDALIKCNSCGKWICDSCSEARITKLKPCINSCGSLYFACATCTEASKDSGFLIKNDSIAEREPVREDITAPETLVSSMKSLFKEHVTQIETKIEDMIERKLNDKIPASIVGDTGSTTGEQDSYASKVLQVPAEVRKIIQEAKNDDKVEENEQERRSANFIIHGAEEYGDSIDSMKEQDAEYIDDILKHLGIKQKPENIVRVGNPNKSNKRPIKVTMKKKDDKQNVMSRLNRLKNTEDEFGKISITEDYTQTERDLIKSWSEKAKKKSAEEDTYIYKVRGDPKNGMKLIRLKKKV